MAGTAQAGTVGLAKYDYAAQHDDELSFAEGDRLVIIDVDGPEADWYWAELDGVEGLIPTNYIEITEEEEAAIRRSSLAPVPLSVPAGASMDRRPSASPAMAMQIQAASESRILKHTAAPMPKDAGLGKLTRNRKHLMDRSERRNSAFMLSIPAPQEISNSDMDGSNSDDEEVKKDDVETTLRKRDRVLQEVVETEQAYLEDLRLIIELYIDPMQSRGLATEEETEAIFANWQALEVVNTRLLRQLKQVVVMDDMGMQGVEDAVRVMTGMADEFKIYANFCNNQIQSTEAVQRLETDNPGFAEFLMEQQADERSRSLPLHSYLLKPLQRITKYPLLCRELLKYTPESQPEYDTVRKTLEKYEEVATHLNAAMAGEETMWALQRALTGWDENVVKVGRRHIRDSFMHYSFARSRGFVSTKDLKKKQVRSVFLFNDIVLIAKKTSRGAYRFKAAIPLADAQISSLEEEVEGSRTLHGIRIVKQLDEETIELTCLYVEDQASKDVWLNDLADVMEELAASIPIRQERAKSMAMARTTSLGNPMALAMNAELMNVLGGRGRGGGGGRGAKRRSDVPAKRPLSTPGGSVASNRPRSMLSQSPLRPSGKPLKPTPPKPTPPKPGKPALPTAGDKPAPPKPGKPAASGDKPTPPKPGDKPTPPKPGDKPAPPKPGDKPAPPKPGDKPTPPKPGDKPAQPKPDKPAPPASGDKPAPPKPEDKPTPPGDKPAPPTPGDKPAPPTPGDKPTPPGDKPAPPTPGDKPTPPGDKPAPPTPGDKPTPPSKPTPPKPGAKPSPLTKPPRPMSGPVPRAGFQAPPETDEDAQAEVHVPAEAEEAEEDYGDNLSLMAICLYDYASTREDELSVSFGFEVTVVSQDTAAGSQWILCELEGQQGLLPATHLQIVEPLVSEAPADEAEREEPEAEYEAEYEVASAIPTHMEQRSRRESMGSRKRIGHGWNGDNFEGWLKKKGKAKDNWKNIFCVLAGNEIVCFDKPAEKGGLQRGVISLEGVDIVDNSEETGIMSFAVWNEQRSFDLASEDEEDYNAWWGAVCGAVYGDRQGDGETYNSDEAGYNGGEGDYAAGETPVEETRMVPPTRPNKAAPIRPASKAPVATSVDEPHTAWGTNDETYDGAAYDEYDEGTYYDDPTYEDPQVMTKDQAHEMAAALRAATTATQESNKLTEEQRLELRDDLERHLVSFWEGTSFPERQTSTPLALNSPAIPPPPGQRSKEDLKTERKMGKDPQRYVAKLRDAVMKGQFGRVRRYLQLGADASVVDADGWAVTHVATYADHHDVLQLLLTTGIPVNRQTNSGDTCLHIAARMGSMACADVLMWIGADETIKNNAGVTAIDAAMAHDHVEVANALKCRSKVFAMDLDVLRRRENRGIPAVMELLMRHLTENDILRLEGVFRKSGGSSAIADLIGAYDKADFGFDIHSIDDSHAVAATLKHFFRSLPNPLVPESSFDAFVKLGTQSDLDNDMCIPQLQALVSQLPVTNSHILHCLLTFLLLLTTFSNENKMTAANIAIVFGPNVMRRAGQTPLEEMASSMSVIKCFKFMIEHVRQLEFKTPSAEP